MEFLWFVLIGLVAGWLAGKLMGAGGSLVTDLIVGVIGAILGGFLFNAIGFEATNLFGRLITATVGAAVLIALLRFVSKKKKPA